jgi:NAD(P)-dependent dehydrogenase (short-subunit alcohol dehydrogenase family)
MDLKNRVAMVTGAAQGIGKATSLILAQYGADIVATDVKEDGLKQTVTEIKTFGRKGMALTMDVSIKSEVAKCVEEALQNFGKIDILVNAAGICPSSMLMDLDEKVWDQVIDVNTKGVFLCSQAVARSMMKNRYGKIINVSSIASKTGEFGNGAYCVSKAGVSMLTQVQALELAPYNINVNAVCPGFTDTELLHNAFKTRESDGNVSAENYQQTLLEKVPLGRMAQPVEIGELIAFLASDKAAYITGEAVLIAGGKEMH